MTHLANLEDHPISKVQWENVNLLRANSYNPNVVLTPELKLLRFSLLKQGWVQPILVGHDPGEEARVFEIIDGYHRYTLCKTDKAVWALTQGLVPVVVMHLTVPERMMLTVRINRAKGNHMAIRMHEIVAQLHNELGVSIADISEGIGADKHEIDTLLMEDIFKKKDVANVPYSKSWVPTKRTVSK
jgi:ParB-like chromosome segregation protein Spo0J